VDIDRPRHGRANNRRARAPQATPRRGERLAARAAASESPAEVRDPREETDWFRRLPEGLRADIVREWRADDARNVELDQRVRRRILISSARMSALFAVTDFVCPDASLPTFVAALATGALLGIAGELLDADRLVTGSAGLASFFALQWITRSGLTAEHMMIFFPFSALCAYLGYLREEPDWT
jgi:hypothetical protein